MSAFLFFVILVFHRGCAHFISRSTTFGYISLLMYEKRLIAFVDVLGWKDAIHKSKKDPRLVNKLKIAIKDIDVQSTMTRKVAERLEGKIDLPDIQITQMSDACILSVRDSDEGSSVCFQDQLDMIVTQMLKRGYLMRGGITSGDLFHEASIVFGPALVRAYEMERDATYPRILIEEETKDRFVRAMNMAAAEDPYLEMSWKKDKDGWYFLDYLQPSLRHAFSWASEPHQALQKVRVLIEHRTREFSEDPKTLEKYEWMATYFNNILQEHPEIPLQPLSVKR